MYTILKLDPIDIIDNMIISGFESSSAILCETEYEMGYLKMPNLSFGKNYYFASFVSSHLNFLEMCIIVLMITW